MPTFPPSLRGRALPDFLSPWGWQVPETRLSAQRCYVNWPWAGIPAPGIGARALFPEPFRAGCGTAGKGAPRVCGEALGNAVLPGGLASPAVLA